MTNCEPFVNASRYLAIRTSQATPAARFQRALFLLRGAKQAHRMILKIVGVGVGLLSASIAVVPAVSDKKDNNKHSQPHTETAVYVMAPIPANIAVMTSTASGTLK